MKESLKKREKGREKVAIVIRILFISEFTYYVVKYIQKKLLVNILSFICRLKRYYPLKNNHKS
jgi:hypothetical protein